MAYTTEDVKALVEAQQEYTFTFPYLKKTDIKVSIEDANQQAVDKILNTDWTLANPTTISLTNAPTAGEAGRVIRIYRDTNIDAAYAEHFPGSAIRADDLNNNNLQTIFSDQERQDYTVDKTGGTFDGNVSFDNNVDLGADNTKTITANGRFDSDLVPSTDSERDLGTTALRWAEVWSDQVVADNIQIGVTGTNEIDTSSGNLTIDSAGGTVTVDDNLTTIGNFQAADIAASGALSSLGTLTVNSGAVIIGDSSVSGDLDVSVDLDVDGVSNLDDVDIDGTVHVQGTSTFVGGVTASGGVTGDLTGNVTGDVSGNAGTATALETARNIGGVSFDGTANINLPGVNIAGNQDTSGNAGSATALETARTIGGVSFDGTANIDLPGVNTTGNQDTTGNAATADALSTTRTIAGNNFNGTQNVSISFDQLSDVNVGTPGAAQDGQVIAWDNTNSQFSLSASGGSPGGLADVVGDATPQLGGPLDVNGNEITSASGGNIVINPDGSGTIELGSATEVSTGAFTIASGVLKSGTNTDIRLQAPGSRNVIFDAASLVTPNGTNQPIYINPDGSGDVQLGGDLDVIGQRIKSSTGSIKLQAHTNGNVIINDDRNTTQNFYVKSGSVENALFVNGSSGRVGVGRNNPGTALDVVGEIQASDTITTYGANATLSAAGSASNPGQVNIQNGTYVVTQTIPEPMSSSYTIQYPDAAGSANQVLQIGSVSSGTLAMQWGSVTVDTSGASTQTIAVNTPTTVDGFTIAANRNVGMMGPFAVNSGETITIGANSKLVILS